MAYKKRRDAFLSNAKKIGWEIDKSKGTMFIWAKIPDKYRTSIDFVNDLFDQTGILFVIISLLPTANPTRAPANPYVFDNELNSIPISFAPG